MVVYAFNPSTWRWGWVSDIILLKDSEDHNSSISRSQATKYLNAL